jgi:hypothetical protein
MTNRHRRFIFSVAGKLEGQTGQHFRESLSVDRCGPRIIDLPEALAMDCSIPPKTIS